MSKIYLPHAEQFDLVNTNLANIANVLAMDMDISTWAGVQKAVRIGVAPALIPVGTQLEVNHSVYGKHLYDVVAHNHFKSRYDKNAHTMTLMCHDVLTRVQYDAPEAFYYADVELPAGVYNFTLAGTHSSWVLGTYQFTLTQSLPAGGQLCISDNADAAITSRQVTAYASGTATTPNESVSITIGNAGTSLGTFGIELNHAHRVSQGSDNYKESAIRQFLNSSSESGKVWVQQTKFDRPPSWMASLAGFVNGLEDEFLSVIGDVVVPCATNNTYESPDSKTIKNEAYTITNKFYLASQREVYGTDDATLADNSILLPYYEEATDADRIKYLNGTATGMRLRSTPNRYSNSVRVVLANGSLGSVAASTTYGIAPLCTIV